MLIAALLNDDGDAASPQEGGKARVFDRKGGEWETVAEAAFRPEGCASMADLRAYIGDACQRLGGCKVLAAGPATGFYRVAFESFGVALWTVAGHPEAAFEQIEAFYAEANRKGCGKGTACGCGQGCGAGCGKEGGGGAGGKGAADSLIKAVHGKAGHYKADLREVMGGRAGINSREALLPFLKEVPFARLELVCEHVPRWFEAELPALGLRADTEFCGNSVTVNVYGSAYARPYLQ
jgi:Fe-only nitrogenase accessory protein AnfO